MNFLYTPTAPYQEQLDTEHLLLRPYQEGDESDFMRLLQESTDYLTPAFVGRLSRVRVPDDARTQVLQLQTDWDSRRAFDFGVWQKTDQAYIGNIALKNLDRSIPKDELALYFGNWPQSKALAQEGLVAVLQFAFEQLQLNKVYMRCTLATEQMGELATENGFTKEGLLRSDYRQVGTNKLHDISYYGMTRPDFEKEQRRIHAEAEAVV